MNCHKTENDHIQEPGTFLLITLPADLEHIKALYNLILRSPQIDLVH